MRVPVLLVMSVSDSGSGLLISDMHEWPAKTPDEGVAVLTEKCGWPSGFRFEKSDGFGAAS